MSRREPRVQTLDTTGLSTRGTTSLETGSSALPKKVQKRYHKEYHIKHMANQRRMIHTSIWASEQFATLSKTGRLLFIGIITHSDDEGRFKASSALIRAEIFPYDDMSSEAIEKEINNVADSGLIVLYEVNGQRYGYLPTWETYQTLRKDRVKSSSIPTPTGWQPSDNQVATNGQPNDGVREGKIREGKAVTTAGQPDGYPETFEEVWKIYPRKTGKGEAAKSWGKLKPSAQLIIKIKSSIETYKKTKQWLKDDGQFIPHLATFLNQRRFDDEPTGTPGSTPPGKYATLGRKLAS